jgi:protein tyrosine phosphatase
LGGFNAFIDLTCEGERPPYLIALQEQAGKHERQILHTRFSFPDFGVPAPEMMVAALDSIDAALAQGCKVYLHCLGGIGRTGTTVGCYFIRHGMEPTQALLHLSKLYHTAAQSLFIPRSPETEEQVRFILNWVEHGLA